MILIFGTLYIIGVAALVFIARSENKKTAQHVHDQYITDTLLQRIDIPDDSEDEDVAVLFSERVSLDGFKSLN